MACSNNRNTPPLSPRAPKIQQQSWDDCGSPPIDLFNPNESPLHSSPTTRNTPKSIESSSKSIR